MSSFQGKERSIDSNTQHSVMANGKKENHAKQGTEQGGMGQQPSSALIGKKYSSREKRRPSIVPSGKLK